MHKSATKCNETICKWCKNKHGASKIIDTLETYQQAAIAEASERLAIAKARKIAEEADAQAQGQVLGGSSADSLAVGTTAAECPASVALPDVSKKTKKRGLTSSLPPRENLRMTPARQAQAAERVSQ
jgi:hypothetical protein